MSIDPALYQRLAKYNTWMTDKAYVAADQMSDTARKEDCGAFFKSVHSTLNHLLFGDRAWMRHFTGRDYYVEKIGVDLYEDYGALKAAHRAMCGDIEDFADDLTCEWLDGSLEWTSRSDGKTRTRPRWLCLTHMFNHQTHHRGQLSTLYMQAGIDIGKTDLPFMPDLLQQDVSG
ncbi:DinB family protein [Labrenzia sp. PHM005]|uniref:DinB family protein n=1 Tax=Labrenzia sp. PHM005 TaxID=2590016 RepID=UPI0011406E7E|nr:DinB family protein [Labrenzia sp. PHM005]QDG75543.1 damage-inducible protein DinB [Labrenzia sp. PHM005]